MCRLLRYGEGKCFSCFGRWCKRYAALLSALGAAFYAMPRVNAARFSSVVCRRYAGHFTAVGAAFYTTARVNAARFRPLVLALCDTFYPCWCRLLHNVEGKCCLSSAVGVGVMLPYYCCWCRLLHSCEGKCCPFLAVGVGVVLSILLLLVSPFTQRRGQMLPVFRTLV